MTADESNIISAIQGMFAALGEDDRARLDGVLSADFHAFENGVQMTRSQLLDLMSQSFKAGRRYRWSVASPQVEIQGGLAAVIYLNVGSITEAPGAEPVPMSWLETALLRRQGNSWRVAFLHSTRTKASPSPA
jgi:Domain of unknown function (DUF4440)